MAVVKELLRSEKDGSLSFGNYELTEKTKLKDFEHQGDVYYVKTFGEITKLEKNGSFLYESEPGTAVTNFAESDEGVSFTVDGKEDAQITVGLAENAAYQTTVDGKDAGVVETGMSGKLTISVEFTGTPVQVEIKKA
jgi:hypothetical protein